MLGYTQLLWELVLAHMRSLAFSGDAGQVLPMRSGGNDSLVGGSAYTVGILKDG